MVHCNVASPSVEFAQLARILSCAAALFVIYLFTRSQTPHTVLLYLVAAKVAHAILPIESSNPKTPCKLITILSAASAITGSMQYPSTEQVRLRSRPTGCSRLMIIWVPKQPNKLTPYIYPNETFPEKSRQPPNKRQKNIGPARSASSKMCSDSSYMCMGVAK